VRHSGATLRQELTLRMAAMARHPAVAMSGVEARVVHPADREQHARCRDLGPPATDVYEDASVRLLATSESGSVIGTARLTLWSPVVGFMVEHEVDDPHRELVLGPRTAELSGMLATGTPREQTHVWLTFTRLAYRVASAHGLDHLYVIADPEHITAIVAPGVTAITTNAARIDLNARSSS
jgi:hypothetical protein